MISSFSYIFFLYKYMVNKVDETYRYIPETLQIFPIFFNNFWLVVSIPLKNMSQNGFIFPN